MGNITTSGNYNAVYKYLIAIVSNFEGDDDPISIDPLKIKSVIIDYNYNKLNFPIFYVACNLTIEEQKKLVKNQRDGKLLIKIQKYVDNSDTLDIPKDYIEEECFYKIPNDSGKNYERPIDENKTEDRGEDVMIGMAAIKHINLNKKQVQGTIKDGTTSSLLANLFGSYDLMMEPLKYNMSLANQTLPSLNTMSKIIKFLNNLKAFYDTKYRYFIDFDAAYLISTSGQGLKKTGEEATMLTFVLRKEYEEANMEGMNPEIYQGMYVLEVSATNADLNDTSDRARSFSDISGISSTGNLIEMDTGLLDDDNPVQGRTNMVRVPNGNTNLIKNMVTDAANKTVSLVVSKTKMDGSIVTLGKQYMVRCGEVYDDKYSGLYILEHKRELYLPEGEGFGMSIVLNMSRIHDDDSQAMALKQFKEAAAFETEGEPSGQSPDTEKKEQSMANDPYKYGEPIDPNKSSDIADPDREETGKGDRDSDR